MNRVIKINQLVNKIQLLKKQNKKIGLCWGVFDLLHPGHVKHLEEAKKMCDVLVVGLTCDTEVQKRKGLARPIFNEKLRAYSMSQLKIVDFVFINFDTNYVEAINQLRPNFCIKGEDYADVKRKKTNQSLEEKTVKKFGGHMVFTKTGPFANIKTTKIIDHIKEANYENK